MQYEMSPDIGGACQRDDAVTNAGCYVTYSTFPTIEECLKACLDDALCVGAEGAYQKRKNQCALWHGGPSRDGQVYECTPNKGSGNSDFSCHLKQPKAAFQAMQDTPADPPLERYNSPAQAVEEATSLKKNVHEAVEEATSLKKKTPTL